MAKKPKKTNMEDTEMADSAKVNMTDYAALSEAFGQWEENNSSMEGFEEDIEKFEELSTFLYNSASSKDPSVGPKIDRSHLDVLTVAINDWNDYNGTGNPTSKSLDKLHNFASDVAAKNEGGTLKSPAKPKGVREGQFDPGIWKEANEVAERVNEKLEDLFAKSQPDDADFGEWMWDEHEELSSTLTELEAVVYGDPKDPAKGYFRPDKPGTRWDTGGRDFLISNEHLKEMTDEAREAMSRVFIAEQHIRQYKPDASPRTLKSPVNPGVNEDLEREIRNVREAQAFIPEHGKTAYFLAKGNLFSAPVENEFVQVEKAQEIALTHPDMDEDTKAFLISAANERAATYTVYKELDALTDGLAAFDPEVGDLNEFGDTDWDKFEEKYPELYGSFLSSDWVDDETGRARQFDEESEYMVDENVPEDWRRHFGDFHSEFTDTLATVAEGKEKLAALQKRDAELRGMSEFPDTDTDVDILKSPSSRRERVDVKPVSYQRNGSGGTDYFVMALKGVEDSPDPMIGIIPVKATVDPKTGDHDFSNKDYGDLLVLDPAEVENFATLQDDLSGWRGSYWEDQAQRMLGRKAASRSTGEDQEFEPSELPPSGGEDQTLESPRRRKLSGMTHKEWRAHGEKEGERFKKIEKRLDLGPGGRVHRGQPESYTKSVERYEVKQPDGTIEMLSVEHNKLVHPRKNKFRRMQYGVAVVPASTSLVDSKTGKPAKPLKEYWTVNQSFSGGPLAEGDALGGFFTGGMWNHFTKKSIADVKKDIKKKGFKQQTLSESGWTTMRDSGGSGTLKSPIKVDRDAIQYEQRWGKTRNRPPQVPAFRLLTKDTWKTMKDMGKQANRVRADIFTADLEKVKDDDLPKYLTARTDMFFESLRDTIEKNASVGPVMEHGEVVVKAFNRLNAKDYQKNKAKQKRQYKALDQVDLTMGVIDELLRKDDENLKGWTPPPTGLWGKWYEVTGPSALALSTPRDSGGSGTLKSPIKVHRPLPKGKAPKKSKATPMAKATRRGSVKSYKDTSTGRTFSRRGKGGMPKSKRFARV